MFFFFACNVCAVERDTAQDSLVIKFYQKINKSVYWFPREEGWLSAIKNQILGNGITRANEWLRMLASADKFGIDVSQEQIRQLQTVFSSPTKIDSSTQAKTDTLLSDLVLHFIKNLEQGNSHFEYDEVSVNHDSLYISQLLASGFRSSVSKTIASLECKDYEYQVYKMYLQDSVVATDSLKRKIIVDAMNYRRYLTINYQPEYILVNIPETEVLYFKNGLLGIKMRAVVGKKTKQTPTLAAYLPTITTFPNWNVPYEIAVTEILPKVKKNENYLEQNNFSVVNAQGDEIDDWSINWNDITEKTFPYFFRQSSGSENALGVVKFDLQNPLSIFLHGTSNQKSFSREYRFLSHGCIRLEKPFELADSLLRGKIDIKALETGSTDKKPGVIPLDKKVPVFIMYQPVKIDGEKVIFLSDEYTVYSSL